MTHYSFLYLCGGAGRRATQGRPKPLSSINGIPMMVYPLLAVQGIEAITELVINDPEGFLDDLKGILAQYHITTPVRFVPAGASRQESVMALVETCSPRSCDRPRGGTSPGEAGIL